MPLHTDGGEHQVWVLQTWDGGSSQYHYVYLSLPPAEAEVDRWLVDNLAHNPPPDQVGAVMPACTVIATTDGELDASAARHVALYGQVDRSGR